MLSSLRTACASASRNRGSVRLVTSSPTPALRRGVVTRMASTSSAFFSSSSFNPSPSPPHTFVSSAHSSPTLSIRSSPQWSNLHSLSRRPLSTTTPARDQGAASGGSDNNSNSNNNSSIGSNNNETRETDTETGFLTDERMMTRAERHTLKKERHRFVRNLARALQHSTQLRTRLLSSMEQDWDWPTVFEWVNERFGQGDHVPLAQLNEVVVKNLLYVARSDVRVVLGPSAPDDPEMDLKNGWMSEVFAEGETPTNPEPASKADALSAEVASFRQEEEDRLQTQADEEVKKLHLPLKGLIESWQDMAEDIDDSEPLEAGGALDIDEPTDDDPGSHYFEPKDLDGDEADDLINGPDAFITSMNNNNTCVYRRGVSAPELHVMNVGLLRSYMSSTGKILPKRETMVSAKFQRKIARLIRRARHLGFFQYKRFTYSVHDPFVKYAVAPDLDDMDRPLDPTVLPGRNDKRARGKMIGRPRAK